MDHPVEEGPSRDDHGFGAHEAAVAEEDSSDALRRPTRFGCGTFFEDQIDDLGLLDGQVRFLFENLPHLDAVLLLVALCAGRPYCWTAARVEQAKLDADGVGDLAHDSAEGVDLPHQVALRDTANRGIA